MGPTTPDNRLPRPVDAVALERARRRLEGAAHPPWLHTEVARRMAERLPLVRQPPRRWIDWWPRAGGGAASLAEAVPQARGDALGASADPPARGWRRWWDAARGAADGGRAGGQAVSQAEPGAYDLVWANMLLHHVADPRALMAQWHAATAVDGFLMFSTLGPGTLRHLSDAYRALGWGAAMGPLVDMHDLGDMLVESGFADPVMDQEVIRLTWRKPEEAAAELRTLGSNVDAARHAGLRTPRWRARLHDTLASLPGSEEDRVMLEFEVVYGHAFKPAPRFRVESESRIGVDDLRRTLRSKTPR